RRAGAGCVAGPRAKARGLMARSGLVFFFGLHVDGFFGFDALGGDGFGLGGIVGRIGHALLEALDGAAQVFAHVAQLLGAEDERHDDENDKPMPDAETTHVDLRCAVQAAYVVAGPLPLMTPFYLTPALQEPLLRLAFSTRPEVPSRRASS